MPDSSQEDRRSQDRREVERRADQEGRAFEMALRRILQDEELVKGFWHRGYQELTEHAGAGASQWVGRRILTAIVVAAVTAGVAYLVRTGSLK